MDGKFTERFECRTLPDTFSWFCDFAVEHGYTSDNNQTSYKNKVYYKAKNPIRPTVNRLLIAIKNREFLLVKTGAIAVVNKTSSQRTGLFRCLVIPGTLGWFKDAAYEFGYIYGEEGAVNRLLEAIMLGEVSIERTLSKSEINLAK